MAHRIRSRIPERWYQREYHFQYFPIAEPSVMARDNGVYLQRKGYRSPKDWSELNVEAIVTGRVVQQGNTLVIRAHLVKAAGTELWGDQYNRSLADVLVTQEEISREICKKLRLRLTGQEQKLLEKHYTKK